jgi:hypothetical protein
MGDPVLRSPAGDPRLFVRSHRRSPRYYVVPGGISGVPPGAFYSSGGMTFIDTPYRSRWDNRKNDPLQRKATEQLRKAPPPPPVKGPLLLAISIADQRLTVYDDGVPIAHSPVSTGTASHPTPTGVFSIIQKQRFHRSNLYSAAPMPFMQRITWSGVALHAGVLPGYPASHGCIRLPNEVAIRLFGTTKVGARVIISQNELTPVEIAHARLFAPKAKPVAAPVVADVAPPPVAKTAEVPTPAVVVVETPAPNGEERASEHSEPMPPPTPESGSDTPVKASATDALAPDEATPAAADPSPMKAAEVAQPEPAKIQPAVATIKDGAAPMAVSTTVTDLRRTVTSLTPRPILERVLRPGPVSVFVSRKEKRLYVRKGFEPVFEMPVEIANIDQPIGTHVFTAMEVGDGSARWSVVSMPAERPRSKRIAEVEPRRKHKGRANTVDMAVVDTKPVITAAEALDRIDMPKDAVDRISALMAVGASLIISDQGLGPETGLETDFVVLTH